jgi:hypothetical protein
MSEMAMFQQLPKAVLILAEELEVTIANISNGAPVGNCGTGGCVLPDAAVLDFSNRTGTQSLNGYWSALGDDFRMTGCLVPK